MSVLAAVAVRFAQGVAMLVVLVGAAWVLIDKVPGGPFDRERELSEEVKAVLMKRYGLADPLHRRIGTYLLSLAQGDLGPCVSFQDFRVEEVLGQAALPSILVGLAALAFAVGLGLPAGVLAASRRGTLWDHTLMAAAVAGLALPNFVVAAGLILVFGLHLGWLPVAGFDSPRYLILPAISLGLPFAATFARLTRASVLETLSQEYVRTARAKGMRERDVLFTHALKPALVPVTAYLGPAAAMILTGSVVVESIFAVPGLGLHFVNA
ncbi:MAG: ABC transporter permease subunit, partial [Planctomycetes bacterium]|nr:ABC transporter permease subunit [Planctomycetota bacterium]